MDVTIPPLTLTILLEASPLKSRILVRRLPVEIRQELRKLSHSSVGGPGFGGEGEGGRPDRRAVRLRGGPCATALDASEATIHNPSHTMLGFYHSLSLKENQGGPKEGGLNIGQHEGLNV